MAPAPRPLPRAAPIPPLLACAPRAHSGRLGPRGRPSRWVPALTLRPQGRVAPARGTQAGGPPPASPHGRHAPSPLAARTSAPSAGRWPHLTQAVAGRAPASPPAARAHGRSAAARPRRPAAARFWGRALLGGGFPRARGGGAGGIGAGEGKGAWEGRGRGGEKGGTKPGKGEKGGGGKSEGEERPRVRPPLRPARYVSTSGVIVSASCAPRVPASSVPVSTAVDAPYLVTHSPRLPTRSPPRTHAHAGTLARLLRRSVRCPKPAIQIRCDPRSTFKSIKPVRFTQDLNTNCCRVI